METISEKSSLKIVEITVITSLYNCEKYLKGFFNAVDKIMNKDECEFLLLHNAPDANELAIIIKEIENKPWFKHIIIDELEGLYKTWNRGVGHSKGEYCAIWNVDDIREPDSLILQKHALKKNTKANISFGDIWGTTSYGRHKSCFYQHPSWEQNKNAYMYRHMIGCFPFWKKSIHDKIGYFEEQFKLVADLDFQIRVSRISEIQKVDKPNGFYLIDSEHKLSSNTHLQIIERNVLNIRYANFDLLNLMYIIPAIRNYKIFNIKNKNSVINVSDIFPNFWFYWVKRLPLLILSIIKLPKDFARIVYHKYK